jgi:hypothetical protein
MKYVCLIFEGTIHIKTSLLNIPNLRVGKSTFILAPKQHHHKDQAMWGQKEG